MPYPQLQSKATSGLTLVEVLVAIAVFTIAMTMALTGLFSVIDASSRAGSQAEAVNNLNFMVDDMIRRIRTGYNYQCGSGGDCTGGDDSFEFTASQAGGSGEDTRYRQNGSAIERYDSGDWLQVTSDSVDITDLTFYVTGTENEEDQSRVLISITGEAGRGGQEQSFSMQTTISQRLFRSPE